MRLETVVASFLQVVHEMGLPGLFDIGFMSLVLYVVLLWFKKRRAAFVLLGIIICGLIYLASYKFHLVLIATVLQAFFAVILIALVVIFQEELKSFFEQIAVWSLNRKFGRKDGQRVSTRLVDVLVHTLSDLSEDRIGALIVLQGKSVLERHVVGGFTLNGDLSEPLLKSIFDPHSVGHDGAVIIEQERVTRFGGQLPLSKRHSKIGKGGMRHAAAMGLAEVTDALCLVVSEETGTISAAWNGEIHKLGGAGEAGQLRNILEEFCGHVTPKQRRNFIARLFFTNPREKAAAVLLSFVLWYIVVHESRIIHKTFTIPLEYSQPASDLYVESMEPSQVQVTFSGPRHAFQFLDPSDVRAVLRLHDYGDGQWAVSLADSNITGPKETVMEQVEPDVVMVEIEKK